MKKNVLLVVKNKKRIKKNLLTVAIVWARVASKTVICGRLRLLLVCGWAWEWREWVLTEWWWL
jgi:hypothetical protein